MTADQPFDWRKHLQVHPAADLFPLLPPDELKDLVDDIKERGVLIIWTDSYSRPLELVDGRNRLDALALLGWLRPREIKRKKGESDEQYKRRVNRYCPIEIVLPEECLVGLGVNGDEDVFAECHDPYAAALSFNIHRRHLTAEQKRELIAKLLKAKPEASNVTVAKQVKADDKTVAKVRRELESTSEIPRLEKTVGADGKARKQPAKKKAATRPKAEPEKPRVLEEYLGSIEGAGCSSEYVILYRAVFGPFDSEEEAERWAQARYPNAGRWDNKEEETEQEPPTVVQPTPSVNGNDIDSGESAKAMKAAHAAQENDGLDIPECLRR